VVLPKENHMQLTEATTLDRKIRGSRGTFGSTDLSWKCFSVLTPALRPASIRFFYGTADAVCDEVQVSPAMMES
jgi:hypothetical protein